MMAVVSNQPGGNLGALFWPLVFAMCLVAAIYIASRFLP